MSHLHLPSRLKYAGTHWAIKQRVSLNHHEKLVWSEGIKGRLPEHYKQFYREWSKGPQSFIHIRPREEKYEKDILGEVVHVQNANIPVLYPDEFHQGLWGGEGVIKGREAPEPQKHWPNKRAPRPRYWFPKLEKGVVYSEVLDRHIAMTTTLRGRRLVDQHFGFDNYLLETPVNEVYAWTLLKIKREILLALARSVVDEEIAQKYEKFRVPEDVADWHGLTLPEAIQKQTTIEEDAEILAKVPKKHEYRRELIEQLKAGHFDDIDPELAFPEDTSAKSTGIFSKIKSFIK